MASAYFTLPSFARARKNKEQLEKTNPQNPVLNDDDEKWLEKHLDSDKHSLAVLEATPTIIYDSGKEKPATSADQQQVGIDAAQVVIPEEQPVEQSTPNEIADTNKKSTGLQSKKSKTIELPSQEEAEAATRNFNFNPSQSSNQGVAGEKKGWTSYLPSLPSTSEKSIATDSKTAADSGETAQQSWAAYASSYLPASWKSKDKDSQAEPVLNDDGSINEEETKQKQEREFAVLLDNLNMSNINNHVFSFSDESRKIYERFALILRDTIEGAPTAYEDMEKLMREAGPTLEKQFKNMPPFVQTLVKSLPAKLSASLMPELLAASSEKPGADLKAQMNNKGKSKTTATGSAANLQVPKGGKSGTKKRRRIPNLKSLIAQEGAVAGILRNVVNFIRVRFPFLASTTNVVMSLAVSILMFVFWYCHKRGKEVRLAREAEANASRAQSEGDDTANETSFSCEDDDDDDDDDDGQDDKDDKDDDKKTIADDAPEKAVTDRTGQKNDRGT